MKVKSPEIFIGHSHEDLHFINDLEKRLRIFGIKSFVAHRDIKPSSKWEKEILRAMRRCDCFMPILSERFKSSETRWPDHEVGMAKVLNKFVYPISLEGVTPYGVIADIQPNKISAPDSNDELQSVVKDLCEKLMDKKILKKAWVVKSFSESRNFEEGNHRGLLLEYADRKRLLKSYDFRGIVKAALNNNQILNPHYSTTSAEYVLNLRSKHSKDIGKKLLATLDERIKSLSWRKGGAG